MDLTCPYPLYRIDKKDGCFRFLPATFQASERNGGIFVSKEERDTLIRDYGFTAGNIQELRCQQCHNCRLNRAREWAVRCCHEMQYHKTNYFITLTYNDAYLPSVSCLDYDGTVCESTLYRKDIVDFFKRWRQYEVRKFGFSNLRILYCGEYGPTTSRPHYHAIVMGCQPFNDLTFFKRVDGNVHYKSKTLTDLWSVLDKKNSSPGNEIRYEIGYATVCEANFESAAYVARYIMKKVTGVGKADFLDYYSTLEDPLPLRAQEFIGMSRRPGIGYQYYQDHKDDIYTSDSVVYASKFKSFSSKPPRYYDRLFDVDFPDSMEDVKEVRKDLALTRSDQHSEEALEVKRKALERNLRKFEKRSFQL